MLPLAQLDVLVVDCQATAASPRGHLLELGWARVGAAGCDAHARLIALPDGERVPPAVWRLTGISEQMTRAGVEACAAWRELSSAALQLGAQPAPTVAHFARFERPFLHSLARSALSEPRRAESKGGDLPLDLVCTHEIARRLLPDLPRCTLRALAGYFGRAVGTLRRSADHVDATAFVWRELVQLLETHGVATWSDLRDWLAAPVQSAPAMKPRTTRNGMRRARRVWPMPREMRLALPNAPGVYRLLRTGGDVLYVGKASSLHDRVNSYFRKQHGVPERMLEMLSQARAVSFEVTPSVLEAALVEPDEIKRHHPPYNIALAGEQSPSLRLSSRRSSGGASRVIWFTAADLTERSPHPTARCPVGPFSSEETLDQFTALVEGNRAALGRDRWAPGAATFDAGYRQLCAAHAELSRRNLAAGQRFLRLGTRLWREGRRDRDADPDGPPGRDLFAPAWTPDVVQAALERLALRAALARRRALWLARMVDAAVVWSEQGLDRARLIVIENGEITVRASVEADATPPIPPGHARSLSARRAALTIARFDRLRVLTTELKRLVSEGAPVRLRFGASPALEGARLAVALGWL